MDNVIGRIDWAACYRCKHGNEDDGGCEKLPGQMDSSDFRLDLMAGTVTCPHFEPKEKTDG